MARLLDSFESDTAKEHDAALTVAKVKINNSRATALVFMSKEEKERMTAIAKAHGLSLSAFFVWSRMNILRNISGKRWDRYA